MQYTNGAFKKLNVIKDSDGWWNCVEVNDIDNDGDLDILAGNAGLNFRIKTSPDKPAKLYVGDFDKNGQIECIPVYFKTDEQGLSIFYEGRTPATDPFFKKEFFIF